MQRQLHSHVPTRVHVRERVRRTRHELWLLHLRTGKHRLDRLPSRLLSRENTLADFGKDNDSGDSLGLLKMKMNIKLSGEWSCLPTSREFVSVF